MEASPGMLATQSYCDGGHIDDRPLCLHSQLVSPWFLDFCYVPTWFWTAWCPGLSQLAAQTANKTRALWLSSTLPHPIHQSNPSPQVLSYLPSEGLWCEFL